MRDWKRKSGMAMPALLLLAAAGCTISVQPWTKPHPVPPSPEPPLANPAAFKAPMPSAYPPPAGYNPGVYPPNGMPPNPYPAGAYAPNPSANNEYTATLVQRLNEAEDQRKSLQEQVQSLKKISRERDDNLQHASYEMEESTKLLKRTREEVRQFAGELDDLRERMRKLEEMRTALKPLIDEIMYHLEREKETAKLPRAPAANN
jgi:hypothetical protein